MTLGPRYLLRTINPLDCETECEWHTFEAAEDDCEVSATMVILDTADDDFHWAHLCAVHGPVAVEVANR